MLPFTLDTHFTYGYHAPFSDEGGPFWCSYSRAAREPLRFDKECEAVATALSVEAQAMGRRPTILLSGGLDSEVVVKSFMAIGADFDTITLRFNGHNEHEMELVAKFVARTGVNHRYLNIDLIKYLNSETAAELFHGARCVSAGMVPHMYLMDHVWFELGGMPVLGNGDLYLENLNGRWAYVELEAMIAWFRHAVRRGILGGIGFFQYSAEVTLAAVRHPAFQRLGSGFDVSANRILQNSRAIKYKMYHELYPDLARRPKFSGYERIKGFIEQKTSDLGPHKNFDQKFIVPFDQFQKLLEPTLPSAAAGAPTRL